MVRYQSIGIYLLFNKTIMTAKNPSFKLGVLNMTISFNTHPKNIRVAQKIEQHSQKMHPAAGFMPKERSYRVSPSLQKLEDHFSPYVNYRRSKKQSIRYFRQHHDEMDNEQYILGLSPQVNKTIQMEFDQSLVQNRTSKNINRSKKALHLRFLFNKRHLSSKHTTDRKPIRAQKLSIDLEINPQESLKEVFTVRQVKTSRRETRNSYEKYEQIRSRTLATKNQKRAKSKTLELHQRNIRPWSPTRHSLGKQVMLESNFIDSNYPEVLAHL